MSTDDSRGGGAARVAEIVAAWRARRDAGEPVRPEEVVAAHPDLADPLRRAFAAIALVDRAAAEARAAVGPPRGAGAALPERIGDFLVVREIGRGATATVYEAEQSSMGRRVALKVLHPTTTLDPKAVERFRREAQIAGRLHHTNILPVHAMGTDRGLFWFAMEHVKGQPLNAVIADLRRLSAAGRGAGAAVGAAAASPSAFGAGTGAREYYARIARAFAGVAEALAAAHAAGVVHRDVKPSNLLLDDEGVLRVLDFGLAHAAAAGLATLTMTGDVVGTPAYMSPEQVRGAPTDGRTDVYGLGATLYELLTLEPPFRGRDVTDCLRRIVTRDPPAPRRVNPRIPRDLETIVLRALERDPARRFASAADLAAELRAFASGGLIRTRRPGPFARAWRRIRRHPARAVAVTTLVALSATTWLLWVRSAALRREQVARGYEECLGQAGREQTGAFGPWDGGESGLPPALSPHRRMRDALDRAVALDPTRPEAPRLIALLFGAEKPALDAWVRAGTLSRREADLATLAWADEGIDAVREGLGHALAETGPPSAYARVLEALVCQRIGEDARAEESVALALADPACEANLRTVALLMRCHFRALRGNFAQAIEDLSAVRAPSEALRRATALHLAALWRKAGNDEAARKVIAEACDTAREARTEESWREILGGANDLDDGASRREWLPPMAREALEAFPRSSAIWIACLLFAGGDYSAKDTLEMGRKAMAVAQENRDADLEARALLSQEAALAWRGEVEQTAALRDRVLSLVGRTLGYGPDMLRGTAALHYVRALNQALRFEEGLAIARNLTFGERATIRDEVLAGKVIGEGGFAATAMPHFDRAVAAGPFYVEALRGRAWARAKLGEAGAALEDLSRAQALHADTRYARVGPLRDLGRREEALALLREVDAQEPRSTPLGFLDVGYEYLSLGDLDAAKTWLEKGLAAAPGVAAAHQKWIDYQVALGSAQGVEEALVRLREQVKAGAPRARVEAQGLEALGRFAEALALLDRLPPPRPQVVEDQRARLLIYLGRGREVYDAWKEDPRTAAKSGWPRWIAIQALWADGQRDLAKRVAAEPAAEPELAKDRLLAAVFDAVAGSPDRAHAALGRVAARGNPVLAFGRATVHALLGETDAALEWLEKAADLRHRRPPVDAAYTGFEPLFGDPRFASLRARMSLQR